MTNLTIESLLITSKNWDRRTVELSIFLDGSGNMFGGSSRRVHAVLHGENSTAPTGSLEVRGLILVEYNIARGANGSSRSSATYYADATDFNNLQGHSPTLSAEVVGNCSGAEYAITSSLGLTSDSII
jgi:hypothetical protein